MTFIFIVVKCNQLNANRDETFNMNGLILLEQLLHLQQQGIDLSRLDIGCEYTILHRGVIGESLDYTETEVFYPTQIQIQGEDLILQ